MNITDILLVIAGTILGAIVALFLERLRNPSLKIELGELMYLEAKQAQWLRLRIVNHPTPTWLGIYRNPALACRGFIKFFDVENGAWVFRTPMEIRWTSSREPIAYDHPTLVNSANQILGYLLDPHQLRLSETMDVWPGISQNFDVVFRYLGEDDCYGWSDENYGVIGWRLEARKLPKGIYLVEISIASGTLQQCKGVFRLINHGDSDFRLETASSEEKEKITYANQNVHDPENWRIRESKGG